MKTKLAIVLLCFFLLWNFFHFKLLEVPDGVTIDEAQFGYNGILIERTLHDENGRFLPVFVLSYGGDWKQPVTQYLTAGTFKVFGPSLINLRRVSVFIASISVILFFILLKNIGGIKFALAGTAVFLVTPILYIQSHLALDNIAPLPLVILWLIFLHQYLVKRNWKYLVLAAMCLGVSFYSYKSMRLILPIWGILTLGLLFLTRVNWRQFRTAVLAYLLATLPFLLIAPILEKKYANSIFAGVSPHLDSYQSLIGGWLANLDPSFLFIKGDSTPFHSTGMHGVFLLATLPLFLLGSYFAIKQRGFLLFLLILFISGPFLFGLVDSIHRGSRMLSLIPMYSATTGLGLVTLFNLKFRFKKALLLGIVVLLLVNYSDFFGYYMNTYPKASAEYFNGKSNVSYQMFAEEVNKRQTEPYIEKELYESEGYAGKFFELAYFNKPFKIWKNPEPVPKEGILMTNLTDLKDAQEIRKIPYYHLLQGL